MATATTDGGGNSTMLTIPDRATLSQSRTNNGTESAPTRILSRCRLPAFGRVRTRSAPVPTLSVVTMLSGIMDADRLFRREGDAHRIDGLQGFGGDHLAEIRHDGARGMVAARKAPGGMHVEDLDQPVVDADPVNVVRPNTLEFIPLHADRLGDGRDCIVGVCLEPGFGIDQCCDKFADDGRIGI